MLLQHQTRPDPRQTDALEQLHGQRARLQRELGSVTGVARAHNEQRERIRMDISRVEAAIREQSRGRFRG